MTFRIVQGSKKLAFLDAHAFVKEDASDAAGDLCRHRSAPLRRDVAAGVEQRLRLLAVCRARRGNLHHRLPGPHGENTSDDQDQHSQGGGKYPPKLTPRSARAVGVVNLQRG